MHIRLLRYLAYASSVFAAVICLLIILNYIQVKRADPLNTQVIKVLSERLQANPSDDQLRREIRELDLLARKAFFTSQWQVRTGGYLLFFSILVTVICLKTIRMFHQKTPEVPAGERRDFLSSRKINRLWLTYTGAVMVILSFIIVIITHHELGKGLELALRNDGNAGLQEKKNAGMQETVNAGMQQKSISDSSTVAETVGAMNIAGEDGYPSPEEIARNFPSFRGPGGNGIVSRENIPTTWDGVSGKNIRWKTEIPLPGYNSPIIWNDRIFLAGANATLREVYCIDLNTGKILWHKSAAKNPGSPAAEPKTIRETGLSAPTMTTDGRRAYALFANGDLVAFDFDGNMVWAKSLGMPENHYGHSSSLIMHQNLLIIQYDQRGSGKVMALDGKTGDGVWETSRNVKVSWASPVIVNTGKRMELILVADPMIASYDPANGKELWHMDCISGEVGPSAAFADGIVYAVNDFSKLSAVKVGSPPELLWEDADYLSDIPSPLATARYLFLVTSYGAVACYDSKNGTKYWEQELGTPVFASPILAGEKVYLLDKKGTMHIFRADQNFSSIGEPHLGEGSSCTPAFTTGKIIIRGDKYLYCIGK